MRNIQPIQDERLKTQNLKNIRFVYALQTIGILIVLGIESVKEGKIGFTDSPVAILFIASTVVLAFLSLKSDERLVAKNLQKIRIAYAIQVIGIVGISTYDFIQGGMDSMFENPLWIVFIISTVVLTLLSMNISVAHEREPSQPGKGLAISIIIISIIAVTVGFLTARTDNNTTLDGVLTASAFFIAGVIPFILLFSIRKRNE